MIIKTVKRYEYILIGKIGNFKNSYWIGKRQSYRFIH